eukprot:COSAG01_NODE_24217_length_786_cov_1.206696_2_plen_65_part_00
MIITFRRWYPAVFLRPPPLPVAVTTTTTITFTRPALLIGGGGEWGKDLPIWQRPVLSDHLPASP